ncbi:hypothetical protein BGW80DRAFT_885231 [Lactifluus volemus]|nr:hypothetical protein BGW80DRAFT_885231 [Lactifluus volemus]
MPQRGGEKVHASKLICGPWSRASSYCSDFCLHHQLRRRTSLVFRHLVSPHLQAITGPCQCDGHRPSRTRPQGLWTDRPWSTRVRRSAFVPFVLCDRVQFLETIYSTLELGVTFLLPLLLMDNNGINKACHFSVAAIWLLGYRSRPLLACTAVQYLILSLVYNGSITRAMVMV